MKFDGWRVQVHRRPDTIKRENVFDGELVSCDSDGRPEFAAITKNHDNLCIWCFDLSYRGGDVREKPLVERKEMLRELLITLDDDRLRYSDEFGHPVKLLKVADAMGVEGIVSKRRNAPYRSWPRADWFKVKTAAWREANKDRWEQFQKRGKVDA